MLYSIIQKRLQQAVLQILPDADLSVVLVRPCPDTRFGDYQANALMTLAKARKMNPRQLATDVLQKLDVADLCEKTEVAGAGFINFKINPSAISSQIATAAAGGPLFFEPTAQPRTVVIDFSSPNVAKPMHVGHIRSTILGDCLARVFRLLGHAVVTDNHIGDWGTQFGMLLIGWKKHLDPQALEADPIFELERIYKKVNELAKQDEAVWNDAKSELASLQKGDEENLAIWKKMLALSQDQFDSIYGRLGVKFDHSLGESFYNPRLPSLVDELKKSGLGVEHEGAVKVFFDDIPGLKETPAVIQKSDGAATYATTDLATLEYRVKTWNPQEIIYVTDGRQQLHFKQIFTVYKKWQPSSVVLAHVWFGSILGDDGTPLKTREGGTVKLVDLLNEAESRTLAIVKEKNAELPEARQLEIARVTGIGAVKYADLLPNRQSDYVFSWDKMLAFNGNTGVYVQYAYTRIRSVFNKLAREGGPAWVPSGEVALTQPQEFALARHLLNFGITLQGVAEEYRPNYLCNYLFELASLFSSFYEACPILTASPLEKQSRLALSHVSAEIMKQGLYLLGIETTDQM